MRRNDRAKDEAFAYRVIDKSTFAVLSITDTHGLPYAVPVSPARIGQMIYVHAALEGRKTDLIRLKPQVSLVFVGDVHQPDVPQTIKTAENDPSLTGKLLSQLFTNYFESAIINGRADFVQSDDEKRAALKAISEKYTPASMPYFDQAVKQGMHATCVIRIKITDITAKSNM